MCRYVRGEGRNGSPSLTHNNFISASIERVGVGFFFEIYFMDPWTKAFLGGGRTETRSYRHNAAWFADLFSGLRYRY